MSQEEGDFHVHLDDTIWGEDAQQEEDGEADAEADDDDGGGRLGNDRSHHLLGRRQYGDGLGGRLVGDRTCNKRKGERWLQIYDTFTGKQLGPRAKLSPMHTNASLTVMEQLDLCIA